MVTLEEIQKHTSETYKEQHDLSHLGNCIGGESGEIQNKIKKIDRSALPDFKDIDGDIEKLAIEALFEIIDEIYYCAETANELSKLVKDPFYHLSLDNIWTIKIALNDLKYKRIQTLPSYAKLFLQHYGIEITK